MSAIKQAAQQKLINSAQALVLWKRARRDQITALKQAVLSNTPCSTERVTQNEFTINNYNETVQNTARERLIGLTNRVVAGMLLHTVRTKFQDCEGSRYAALPVVTACHPRL